MEIISEWNSIRFNVLSRARGLPYLHQLLLNHLLNLVDIQTGTINDISYSDLISILTVSSISGRKSSGAPSKQILRNAIATIKREFGDHFKVITEGQQLKFQFPQLPTLLAEAFSNTELNTVPDTAENHSSIEEHEVKPCEVNIEVNTELNLNPAFESAVKNNINNNKTNLTNRSTQFSSKAKKSISEDFYPSQEIVAIAKARGFDKVTSQDEISAFIEFNKKNETQWADFNPVFLQWLERGAVYEQKKQLRELNKSSRSSYVSGSHQRVRARSTIAEVMERNKEAIHPGTGLPTGIFGGGRGHIIEAVCLKEPNPIESLDVGLAELDELVRTTVYQQARQSGQRYLA